MSADGNGSFKFTASKSESSVPAAQASIIQHPPDGAKAWSVALGSFLLGFVTMGLMYSQGIFVEPLLNEFKADLATTSLVATLSPAMFYFCGLFASPMAIKYGVRRFTIAGSILWIVGCFAACVAPSDNGANRSGARHPPPKNSSASPNINVSIVTQGIITGLGTGLTYWVAMAVTPACALLQRRVAS